MPIIKSAKKKLKVDRKRESSNKKAKASIDLFIKKTKKKPTLENIRKAFKAIDKGVKKDIFHKNKAARIKSRLSKIIIKKLQPLTKAKLSKPLKIDNIKKTKKIR